MRTFLTRTGFALAALSAGFAAAFAQDLATTPVEPTAAPAPVAPLNVLDQKEIRIADAFPNLEPGRNSVFRARKILLAPGAETEVWSHEGRPGITFVATGEVLEHRAGERPLMHAAGDYTLDTKATVHSWSNPGSQPAVLLIVDLIPAEAAAS